MKESSDTQRGPVRRSLVACGGLCTVLGILLFVGVLVGLLPAHTFALGEESGLRVMGAICVGGCIMLAIGFSDE
jgi:hypothetical protein